MVGGTVLVGERAARLFAGSDGGAEHWAVIASLIETCELIGVEPYAYASMRRSRTSAFTI